MCLVSFCTVSYIGKDGVEGETPEDPGWHFFGGSFGGFDSTSELGGTWWPPFVTVNYEIKGKNATWPSKGGDGGSGGLGGHRGDSFIVELQKLTQCSIQNQNGRLCRNFYMKGKALIE